MRFSNSLLSRLGLLTHEVIKKRKITGGQIIYNKLLEKNIKDVFLYSGGSVMPLIDCFYQGPINYYINTHEQNCGHSATCYAKTDNQGLPGVVITTSGPGITNLITPMLDAQNDSTPLVVFSGQVGLKNMGTDAFQEAPATEITRPFTKFSYCLQTVEEIPEIIEHAFNIANSGKKGVVHIDVPKCISSCEIDYDLFEKLNNIPKDTKVNKNDNLINNIKEVAYVINKSKKPILYIGQGASEASKELLEIINKNNIPCTSTIHGKGIFREDHDHSLKWCGMHGYPAGNFALQESDCIICIGARFDDRTTGNPDLYAPIAKEKKQIIHVDIDNKQFKKSINSNYNILCDSKVFISELNKHLNINIRKEWISRIQYLKNKHKFKYNILEDKINVPMAIKSINNYLKKEKNNNNFKITTGVGNHQMMTYQFIDGFYPKQIHSSGSLGVMGAGLPYAIGAQLSNPKDLVIDIDGDSSFMMTMSDLKTIKEYNLPVKIALMNDNKQMMVNIWERLFFNERYTATINNNNPNFVDLVESFGIKGFICSNPKELQKITNEFLSFNGPALCEYKVEGEICLPLVGPGKALDDMILFDEYHKEKLGNKKIKFDKNYVPS